MKAYKIDSYNNRIEEVQVADWKDISPAIGCELFCVGATLPNRDTLFVDDEGFLNGKVTRGFTFNGKFLAGNGLILGGKANGDSASVKTKELDIASMVTFAPAWFSIDDAMREKVMSGVSVVAM